MHALWSSSLAAAAFLAACAAPVGPPPSPPAPDRFGPCEPACENLARLGCEGAEGSPGYDEQFGTADDVPCAIACRRVLDADEHATLHQTCVAAARSCAAADECFVR